MINAINESIESGLTQKSACATFNLSARKFRRWSNPKLTAKRTAWNKIRQHEADAIVTARYKDQLLGKPVSHIFVNGHDFGEFFVSLSTVYRVLKSKNLIEKVVRQKKAGYVSAHALMKQGFSLLCYDGTVFVTEAGIQVWAIPVLILPQRFLIHIGYSLNSVTAKDLVRTVKEAVALLPELLIKNLIAFSDRGSAMKADYTKKVIKELLGAPIHYGRPHTPDDQAWIEAFIKTLKYHRDAPLSFKLVNDVAVWLDRFPDIYNNEPHSSLKYVTPLQAVSGQQEVILNKRKNNLTVAKLLRYTAWKADKKSAALTSKKEIAV